MKWTQTWIESCLVREEVSQISSNSTGIFSHDSSTFPLRPVKLAIAVSMPLLALLKLAVRFIERGVRRAPLSINLNKIS